jgi:DNA-binding GntR family transcriptional regulator
VTGEAWVSTSAPYVAPRGAGQRDAWSEETAARGRRGTQRVLEAGETAAPAEVAALLGVAEGEGVVVRRRLILLDGEPVELTDTYYPRAIAAGTRLAETAKISGGAVTLLATLGHTPAKVHEEIHARLPTPAERDALALDPADAPHPVLCLTRVTLDATGTPYQADLTVFRADRQRLRYELDVH